MNVRAVDVARFGVGCAELFATRTFAGNELGHEPDERERVIARVLGVRQVGQALLTGLIGFRRLGVVVDVLHALSMVGLAVLLPDRYRRAGMTQAATATFFAVSGLVAVRRSR